MQNGLQSHSWNYFFRVCGLCYPIKGKLPQETMALLKKYKEWYDEQAQIWGSLWKNTGFVFVQEDGSPMDPSSLTNYCGTFSKKYGLPHINPHAFRHTMVSLLYYNGVDPITISKRLGHSKVSTTTDSTDT